ncbi:arginine--tRNA ligase [Candidatus Gracilibacteria bacterium CG2_30_37_12]|nr:MAG: arginine--tRNA ligase [Candidatus Gracilibacteria bacterium CG2_30_37_12]
MSIVEDLLLDIVVGAFPKISEPNITLDTPPKKELGDFAFNIFPYAKVMKLAPSVIAEKVAEGLKKHSEYFKEVSIMGGYVNFFLTNEAWVDIFSSLSTENKPTNNKTVVVDYIGLNIGKPFHIGHLCTPSIGQAIVNLYRYQGYNVIGDNHLGDWGGLFGKLIAGYKKYGDQEKLKEDAIEHLLEVYIKITADAEADPLVEELCRNEFKKLSESDIENMELWKEFTSYSVNRSNEIIGLIGAKPDYAIGESFYEGLPLPKLGNHPDLQYSMKSVVAELIEKEIATKNEDGSVGVIFPEESKIPSCMLAKRDGTHGYLASDLAATKYRMTNGWNPTKILICSDVRQQLHFRQCFSVARQAWPELLEHTELYNITNGYIRLKEGAMSTRKGIIIRLQDLIEEGFARTKNILVEKGQSLSNADIEAISIGAIKYSYLAQDREKDVVFDWDKALSFEGNSGPYIQYSYVRAKNIIEKSGKITSFQADKLELSEYDRACLRRLSFFNKAILDTANKYKPHILATYCYELASEFNAFYVHTPKILEEQDANLRNFRLSLIMKISETLKKGFELLAIEMPEKM